MSYVCFILFIKIHVKNASLPAWKRHPEFFRYMLSSWVNHPYLKPNFSIYCYPVKIFNAYGGNKTLD